MLGLQNGPEHNCAQLVSQKWELANILDVLVSQGEVKYDYMRVNYAPSPLWG